MGIREEFFRLGIDFEEMGGERSEVFQRPPTSSNGKKVGIVGYFSYFISSAWPTRTHVDVTTFSSLILSKIIIILLPYLYQHQ